MSQNNEDKKHSSILNSFGILSCDRNIDWNTYLGNQSRSHYSELDQIHDRNINSLELAWEYSKSGIIGKYTQIQCSPIVVDGVLYGTNPSLELFAIDAGTAKNFGSLVT